MIKELPTHWFERVDNNPDEDFYIQPRLVAHIDPETIAALTEFYREFIPAHSNVLDLMSSWISHLPLDLVLGRVSGLGMNAEELAQNPQLTDRCVLNLNTDPNLPYEADQFDRMTLAVSIQYLTSPIQVMSSAHDKLKPGGRICIAMSHRLFPTKAIAAFQQMPTKDRVSLVTHYLQEGGFSDVEFIDRSPMGADPLWLVVGTAN
jgi:SAM-dependent methyltransferase